MYYCGLFFRNGSFIYVVRIYEIIVWHRYHADAVLTAKFCEIDAASNLLLAVRIVYFIRIERQCRFALFQ